MGAPSRALLLCGLLYAGGVDAQAVSLYVSTTGSDGNAGTSPSAPFATLPRAQTAIVTLRSGNGGRLPGDVTVNVGAGTFFLAAQMNVTAADGGDAGATTVTYVGAGQGATIISAGAPVTGWMPVAGQPAVFSAHLDPAVFPQAMVRQLFAGGQRRELCETAPMIAVALNQSVVIVGPGQVPWPAAALAHAFVRTYHNWVSAINGVASFNAATSSILPVGVMGDPYFSSGGNRYSLQNVADVPSLAPGSFFFDPVARVVTYRALPGEDPTNPSTTPIVAERLPIAVAIAGTPSQPVVNVAFTDLTISHAAAFLEETCIMTGCGDQSEASDTIAAVVVNYASGVLLSGVEVACVGQYGVWLESNVFDSTLSHCLVRDMGAGGVRVGTSGSSPAANVTRNVTVADSTIVNGGNIVQAGCGVLLQEAAACSVLHNHIYHMRYTGVSTGWTWGYSADSDFGHTVAYNLIHDIGLGVLSDMGCIYNLGISPGTLIDHNICHDVIAYEYGGWGLYTDEGSSFVTISNNIVFHTKSAGIHQHYGENNSFVNNVVAFPAVVPCTTGGCDSAAVRSSQHSPGSGGGGVDSSFTFERNILLLDNANASLFYTTMPTGFVNMTLGSNVYWSTALASPGTQLLFPPTQKPTSFAAWQAEGKDGRSVIADPLFRDAGALDFSHFEPGSPALTLGFVPIDTSTVGPR